MDLGLEYYGISIQPGGFPAGFGRSPGYTPSGHGHIILSEKLLGLIFVDVHILEIFKSKGPQPTIQASASIVGIPIVYLVNGSGLCCVRFRKFPHQNNLK
jgi:hypothetical protein